MTTPARSLPLDQSGLAARRLALGAVTGAAVIAASLGSGAALSVALLAGWDAAAFVFLAWVWSTVATKDATATARSAQAEDASRAASELVLVGAGTASLVAVAFTLAEAGQTEGAARRLLIGLAVGSVVVAWACVHTVYALRYARLYYSDPVGGIDFKDDDPPSYLDFAYVALTIGMTSQVSDTSLTARRLRRAAIHHALLSYLFGTVVVAMTINIVAGLLGR